MQEQREYKVQLTVTTAHEYVVTARTEEEAEGIAEDLLSDGDRGKVLSTDVESRDAYAYDDEEIEEYEDDAEGAD